MQQTPPSRPDFGDAIPSRGTDLADVSFALQLAQRRQLVGPADALLEDAHLLVPVGLLALPGASAHPPGGREPAAAGARRAAAEGDG
eukprot:301343-Chlamydomonas_euryale.AAC.1